MMRPGNTAQAKGKTYDVDRNNATKGLGLGFYGEVVAFSFNNLKRFSHVWEIPRHVLEVTHYPVDFFARRPYGATAETAFQLLTMLSHKDVTALAGKLANHLEELLTPLAWLEEHLAPWRKELDADTEELIM